MTQENPIPPMPRDPERDAEPVDFNTGKGIKSVMDQFESLRRTIEQMPASRYRALALTSLETSLLWVGRGCGGNGWT